MTAEARAVKYDVHIYAVVRVKVAGVEADSQVAAIQEAQKRVDLEDLLHSSAEGFPGDTTSTEYAEEITGFLVDEVGDENYSQSKAYLPDGVMLEPPPKEDK